MLVVSLAHSWMRRRRARRATSASSVWQAKLRYARLVLETLEERVPLGNLLGPAGMSQMAVLGSIDQTQGDLPASSPLAGSPHASSTILINAAPVTQNGPVVTSPSTSTSQSSASSGGSATPSNPFAPPDVVGTGTSFGDNLGVGGSNTNGGSGGVGSGGGNSGAGSGQSPTQIIWAPPLNPLVAMGQASDSLSSNQTLGAQLPPTQSSQAGVVQITGFQDSKGTPLAGVNVTNDPKPIIVGNGVAGETLTIQIDSSVSGTTTVGANAKWSYAVPTALSQGTHNIQVESSGAGIVGLTTTAAIGINSTPPTVQLTAPDFADYRAPQLQVQVSNAPYGVNPTVHIDVDLKHNGSFTDPGDQDYATATLGSNGTASFALTPLLPAGTFSIRARVSDVAGNVGVSATSSMVVDPNAGYDGSQPLLDLAYGLKYGTPVETTVPTTMNTGGAAAQPSTSSLVAPTKTGASGFQPPAGYSFLEFDQQGGVLVDVHSTLLKYLPALTTELTTQFGFMVSGTYTSQDMVQGWLPINEILSLPNAAHFGSVDPVYAPFTRGGPLEQGVGVIKADTYRTALGVTGVGEKVGIISDSVNEYQGGLSESVNAGALPNNVQVIADDPSGNGTDEGRAMLEIVHAVAPGAALAFDSVGTSPQTMVNSMNALAGVGSNIIADDIGFSDEPFFNDGVISQGAEAVVNNGIFYDSAAGNDSNHGYLATWNGVNATVGGVTGTFQNVKGGSPLQTFTLGVGDTTTLSFEWDSAFLEGGGTGNFTVNNDVQVLVTDANGNALSTPQVFNSGGTNINEAFQFVQFTNDGSFGTNNFAFSFNLVSGSAPGTIAWVSQDDGDPTADPVALNEGGPTLYGHPEAVGVVGVGAVDWSTPTTPEPFSALGRMPIFFDNSGTRLPQQEIRAQPEVAGPDGVNTTFFSTPDGNGGFQFFGTSAATPHIAGAAALLLQQDPSAAPTVVAQYLQQTAVNLNDPPIAGSGLIQLTLPFPLPGGTGPTGPTGPGPGPGLPTGLTTVISTSDTYKPNLTSDTAFDLGQLTVDNNVFEYQSLVIDNAANMGLPDYEWFKWNVGSSGFFTATAGTVAGNLELHLFTVDSSGTLVDMGDDTSGNFNLQVFTAVTAGQEIYAEVKGKETSPGVVGQGFYNLFVQNSM